MSDRGNAFHGVYQEEGPVYALEDWRMESDNGLVDRQAGYSCGEGDGSTLSLSKQEAQKTKEAACAKAKDKGTEKETTPPPPP